MKKICAIFLTIVMVVATIHPHRIMAANGFSVIIPQDQLYFVGQEITADMFDLQLNNANISDYENIEISPNKFDLPGVYQVGIQYINGSTVYYEKIDIDVIDLAVTGLEISENVVTLIEDQEVTPSDLPSVYLRYNDGTRALIDDYSIYVDWNKALCTITYDTFSKTIDIIVEENRVQYITVQNFNTAVPENQLIDQDKLIVTAYYTNGTVEVLPDYAYDLSSYVISAGRTTEITVSYKGATATFTVVGVASTSTTAPTNTSNPGSTTADPIATPNVFNTGNIKVESNLGFGTSNSSVIYLDDVWVEVTSTSNCFYQIVSAADGMQDKWTAFSGHISFNSERKKSVIYIKYSEANGNTVILQSDFFCIDRTKPTTNIKTGKKYTKNQIIKASDSISGISSIKITGDAKKTIKSGSTWKTEGNFSLTITDKAGNTRKVKFSLAKPAKKITVTYSVGSVWSTLQFKAKVTGTSRSVKWSVSNKKIASITQKGVLKAKNTGTCYVKCKLDKITVKKKIKVSSANYVIVY